MEKTIKEKFDQIESLLLSQKGLTTERVDSIFPNLVTLLARDVDGHLLVRFSSETHLYPVTNEVAYIDISGSANERSRLTLLKGSDGNYSWSLNNDIQLAELVNNLMKNAKRD